MKKLIPVSIIFIISIITIGLFGTVAPNNVLTKKRIEEINIDNTRAITLGFMAKDIQVLGWNKDNVEVQINSLVYGGNKPVIEAKDNNITLKPNAETGRRNLIIQTLWPWLPLMQFERYRNIMNNADNGFIENDFIIYLPRNITVNIEAGDLTIYNCKLASLSAGNASVRNCTFLKGFSGTTADISVSDSIISRDTKFNSQSSNFENNTYIND